MERFRTCFDTRDLLAAYGPSVSGVGTAWGIASLPTGVTAVAANVTLPGISGDNRAGRPGVEFVSGTSRSIQFSNLFPAVATAGAHFAFYVPDQFSGSRIFSWLDGTNRQLELHVSTAGVLQVYNGTTLLGTSTTNALGLSRWYSIEIQTTTSTSAGAVTVQVNTIPWITLTGVNTQATGNATVNGFVLDSLITVQSSTEYFTDVVIWDTTGTVNNTFYGDCRVDWMAASATAATLSGFTSFTGGASDPIGTLYQSPTPTSTVLQPLGTAPIITGAIKSVTASIIARKTDNSFLHDAEVMVGTSSSGSLVTESAPAVVGSSATWAGFQASFPTNPAGSTWTNSDLASLQFGVKIV